MTQRCASSNCVQVDFDKAPGFVLLWDSTTVPDIASIPVDAYDAFIADVRAGKFDRPAAVSYAPTTEGERKPDVSWRCTKCGHVMSHNLRYCPRCSYTVFAPVWPDDPDAG